VVLTRPDLYETSSQDGINATELQSSKLEVYNIELIVTDMKWRSAGIPIVGKLLKGEDLVANRSHSDCVMIYSLRTSTNPYSEVSVVNGVCPHIRTIALSRNDSLTILREFRAAVTPFSKMQQ
jgi:hypothetical protein